MPSSEYELLVQVYTSSMAEMLTPLAATVESVQDEDDAADIAGPAPPDIDELKYFIAKNIDDFTDEERMGDPDMQRWYDIVNLLGDKSMDFSWSEETHCVIAAMNTSWERLKSVSTRP